jgi:hypothetical protein
MKKISTWILFISSIVVIVIHYLTEPTFIKFVKLYQYYTLQSNLIITIILGLTLLIDYKIIKKFKFYDVLLVASTTWIFVTGVMFHLFLSDLFNPTGLKVISNFLEHTFIPFGMLFYFLVFSPKYKYKKTDLLFFPVFPLTYSIVSLIRGAVIDFYPYWFINPIKKYPDGLGSYLNQFYFLIGAIIIFEIFGFALLLLHRKVVKINE